MNLQYPSHFDFTTLIALFGLAISLFTLGWNVKRDIADRARIKVAAFVGRAGKMGILYLRSDVDTEDETGPIGIVMTATNIGRRSIELKGWAGEYQTPVKGKKLFLIKPGSPVLLSEGTATTVIFDIGSLGNVKDLFAFDAAEKHWKLRRRDLKQLKVDYVKFTSVLDHRSHS